MKKGKGKATQLSILIILTISCILQSYTTNFRDTVADEFDPYTELIPGTDVSFDMIPIPEGKFTIGSPENAEFHQDDEGPQKEVNISPFWMGKVEVSWDMYDLFAYQEMELQAAQAKGVEISEAVDAVARPTPPYLDMSFGMGKDGYPAICMTQYAAQMFCKWLTAKTGHFYRLPTEAEWEYACRAGTTTSYYFGDDPAQLEEYAWYYENTVGGYEKTGTKKPNPWGLYDMHGNVAEWTSDQYIPDYYAQLENGAKDPGNKPTELYPRTTRGGSWDDDAEALRSAARLPSNPRWKQQDPQIPKSRWWHTDARFVGFRLVRPLNPPSPSAIEAYWPEPIEDL
jgi:formylglycine-generating enzyme required for sulfatase activity